MAGPLVPMIKPNEWLGVKDGTGTYYRVIKKLPLDPLDFRSQVQQGRQVPPRKANDPTYLRHFGGASVHDTLDQSRNLVEDLPKLGNLIAELEIPDGTEITYEVVDTRNGHGVLYNADPEDLVRLVSRVFRLDGTPVEPAEWNMRPSGCEQ